MQAVLRYLAATSSPTPSRRRRRPRTSTASCSTPSPATASSTRARWRCCCGWPASPRASSTGFTTGVLDRKAGEYVVRDFDAHSWVEVWYSGYGWVTFDPTPAASPARSQPTTRPAPRAGRRAAAPDLGGDIRSERGRGAAATGGGTPWTLIGARRRGRARPRRPRRLARRRHRRRLAARPPGPVAELERALSRARRDPGARPDAR